MSSNAKFISWDSPFKRRDRPQLRLREEYNSKRNYYMTVFLMRDIYISGSEIQYKDGPLDFVIYFSKNYIKDLGVKFGWILLEWCNPNLAENEKFSGYTRIFHTVKSKNVLNINSYFRGTVMDFYIWYWPGKNLQCTFTCSLPRGKEAQEAHQQ